jgi:CRISPR/Cas system-associated exonuclease Cas4 (RecB family)
MSTSPPEDASPAGPSAAPDDGLLPEDHRFSQGSLQDFKDCPRRFLLRHIERRAYPAAEAEPIRANELRKERGIRFHEILCQAHSGVPHEALDRQCGHDPTLEEWWSAYKGQAPVPEDAETWAEVSLEGQVEGYAITATYDLVARRPDGTFEIFDWKTSRRRPSRDQLAARLQTTVYPYLLVAAGACLNGGAPIEADDVRMTYWFSRHPDSPATFEYSSYNRKVDEETIADLVADIAGRTDREAFEKTDDERHCRYCTYRSHCGRGTRAGQLDEAEVYLDDTASLEDAMDDVEEIEF